MATATEKPGPKVNFLERAIGAVAPSWALGRAKANQELIKYFNYDGANPGTARGNSGGLYRNASPETAAMTRDRINLIWEARDMERNFPIVAGLLDRIAQYACHRLEYKAMTGDPKTNVEYERYFHDWCSRADISGRLRLKNLCQLAVRSYFRDGDMGFIMTKRNNELRLQPIEADRIGNPLHKVPSEREMGGVIIGNDGQPLEYEIWNRSNTNQYSKDHNESADNFIHFWRPIRFDQYRGVSPLAPVIPHCRDAYELIALEKAACKLQSSYTVFKHLKDPNSNSAQAAWDQKPTINSPANTEIVGGKIQTVTDAEDITFAPAQTRPSGAFMQFHETIVRLIALGVNFPFGFCWNMGDFGGTSSRIELKQAERRIQDIQQMLVEIILNRVRDQVISMGIANKAIPAHAKWREGRFTFGAWLTADVGYQTNADLQLIQLGLKSKHQWGQENDNDFETVQDELYSEIEYQRNLSAEKMIPMELLPGGNPMATALLSAAEQSRESLATLEAQQQQMNAPPPPPPGLIGSVGDKGVKTLLDLNQQVADGVLPRQAAVQQVMAIFGTTEQQAEVLVPPAPSKKDLKSKSVDAKD
jgi:capsid protein